MFSIVKYIENKKVTILAGHWHFDKYIIIEESREKLSWWYHLMDLLEHLSIEGFVLIRAISHFVLSGDKNMSNILQKKVSEWFSTDWIDYLLTTRRLLFTYNSNKNFSASFWPWQSSICVHKEERALLFKRTNKYGNKSVATE